MANCPSIVAGWLAACLLGLVPAVRGNEAPSSWIPSRTPDGAADLQGIWTSATLTTLERPSDVDDLVLSTEEALELERRNAEFYAAYDQPGDSATGALPAGGDPGGYNTFWMDEGTKLAVVRNREGNREIRSSLIVDPPDGEVPYRLWAHVKRVRALLRLLATDDPEQRDLGERCIVGFGSTGGPPMLPVLYNNNYQIVQTKTAVMILVEMNHDARIVRIGGTHPPPDVQTWLGDSVGHWEGNTLVVETTNFHPGQNLRVSTRHALYTSEHLTVTERFTRVAPDELLYEFTMDDPETYSQRWRGEVPLRRVPGPIFEYACHEGNYSLPNILAGARAEEREGSFAWWHTLVAGFGD